MTLRSKLLIIAAVTLTTGTVNASRGMMSLDDLSELNKERAHARHVAERRALRLAAADPVLRKLMIREYKKEDKKAKKEREAQKFPGKGNKVGGRKDVNKILDENTHKPKKFNWFFKKKNKTPEIDPSQNVVMLSVRRESINPEN